jgi:cytochrome P450
MTHAFTSRAVERMRAAVAARIDELLAALDGRDEFDLIGEFAWPLPAAVIADLLGVPRDAVPRLKAWSDELSGFVFSGRHVQEKYERAARGVAGMAAYFARLMEEKRARPDAGLISALIASSGSEEPLTPDELEAMCVLLLFAGHETTTHLIGNGMLALLRDPDRIAALRADSARLPSTVEELLRLVHPNTLAIRRFATCDLEIGGTRIRRGETVLLALASANRDPARFADPDRLDPARAGPDHLALGHGPHYCLGASLARLELHVAFDTLLRRLPGLRLAVPETGLRRRASFRSYDLESLPVSV